MSGARSAAPLTYPSAVNAATATVETASTSIGRARRQASATVATPTSKYAHHDG